MVALLKSSELPRFQRYVEAVCSLAMYLIGSFIALMSALYIGHKSSYYAGMTLTLIAVGVFVPIGPLHVFVTSTAIYFTFLALLIVLDPTPLADWDWTVFAANSIFLLSTATTVTVGAFFNRRLRRRLSTPRSPRSRPTRSCAGSTSGSTRTTRRSRRRTARSRRPTAPRVSSSTTCRTSCGPR